MHYLSPRIVDGRPSYWISYSDTCAFHTSVCWWPESDRRYSLHNFPGRDQSGEEFRSCGTALKPMVIIAILSSVFREFVIILCVKLPWSCKVGNRRKLCVFWGRNLRRRIRQQHFLPPLPQREQGFPQPGSNWDKEKDVTLGRVSRSLVQMRFLFCDTAKRSILLVGTRFVHSQTHLNATEKGIVGGPFAWDQRIVLSSRLIGIVPVVFHFQEDNYLNTKQETFFSL